MKQVLFAFLLLVVLNISIFGDGEMICIETMVQPLLGTWDRFPETGSTHEKEVSWGKARYVIHISFLVSRIDNAYVFQIPDEGYFEIQMIEERETSILKVHTTSKHIVMYRKNEGIHIFHFVSEDQFWIEESEDYKIFHYTGPEHIYYQRSGPEIINIGK